MYTEASAAQQTSFDETRTWGILSIAGFANFRKRLTKGAVSVNQIVLACSGPPLSSNVLNACMWHVSYVSTLMSLQQIGQTRPQQ